MRFVLGTLLDPFFQQCDLFRFEILVGLGRRHAQFRVRLMDQLDHQRSRRISRHDGRFSVLPFREGKLRGVEPQRFFFRFARAGVGAVTMVTGLGENRLDVLVERNRFRQQQLHFLIRGLFRTSGFLQKTQCHSRLVARGKKQYSQKREK